MNEGLYCAYCGTALILDVPRLAEGVRLTTQAGAVPLIAFGTPLPATYSETFAPAFAGQETIKLHVTVGNSNDPKKNRTVVNAGLTLKKHKQQGIACAELTVKVGNDGRLTLTVEELDTKDNRLTRDDLFVAVGKPTAT